MMSLTRGPSRGNATSGETRKVLASRTQWESLYDLREVNVRLRICVLLAFLLLCSGKTSGQSSEGPEKEAAVLEFGAAAGHSLSGNGSNFGPTVAAEVTPIENWLELEAGVTPLFNRNSTEWDVDLLFKKPWTLSNKAEFMFGVGPEWIHTSEYQTVTNSLGAEAALDFMFWPSGKHKFGWYLEPGYDHSFGPGHEQSVGISGGLLIVIP